MEDITNLIKESELEIQRIENESKAFKKEYLEKKGELFKIVRSDFLTGGIIASSLFIIINSITNFFGILFPYDLLIGISGFFIGIIILLVPIAKPKFGARKFNREFLNVIYEFRKNFVLRAMSFRSEIEKAYDKYNFEDEIEAKLEYFKEIGAFTDKIYDLGLEGLEKLTRNSPRNLSEEIAKYNKGFIQDLELIPQYRKVKEIGDLLWKYIIKTAEINKGSIDELINKYWNYVIKPPGINKGKSLDELISLIKKNKKKDA